MIRPFSLALLTFAGATVALAGGSRLNGLIAFSREPLASAGPLLARAQDKDDVKKEDIKKDEKGEQPENDPERVKKIIGKLTDDFDSADKRLTKDDPGQETRKTQDDIIKGLDELIKQQENNNQGGGGGGGGGGGQTGGSQAGGGNAGGGQSGGGQAGGGQAGGGNTDGGQANKGGGNKKNPSGLNDQNNKGGSGQAQKKGDGSGGKGNQGKDGFGDKGQGGDKVDLASKGQQGDKNKDKDKGGAGQGKGGGGAGGGGGGINDPQREKNTIADLHKEVWGHLPDRDRTKMDVYSRERFMPRYEEVLRQYYRTIAESSRRREGD